MLKEKDLTEQLMRQIKIKRGNMGRFQSFPFKNRSDYVAPLQAAFSVVKDAVPTTLGLLFIFVIETINIIYIGQYNNSDLISGIGIGTLYINATGYILGAGLIGGIDTLCSQTYGAKKYKLMGLYANIARLIVFVFFVVICLPLIFYSSKIFGLIGLVKEVSEGASRFAISMIPSLFFALQYNTSLRYLQAMNIFTPGMWVTLTTALLHPIWCCLFIDFFSLDVVGAGIAMGITQCLNFVLISLYILYANPCPESCFFMDTEIFKLDLILDYLNKSIPAAILFSADWLSFEILLIMSCFLSPLDLAANVCFFNFINLIAMIPMGFAFASTTLVGNSLGSSDAHNAEQYIKAALICGLGIISIITLLVWIFQSGIPCIYTSEADIAALVSKLLGISVCLCMVDSVQVILHGVIKGLGKQQTASIICLTVLYPVNIPLAYCFAFVWGYGLLGLWYSQLCCVFMLAGAYASIVFFSNYEILSEEIIEHFNAAEKIETRIGSN